MQKPSTTSSIADAALPHGIVRVRQLPQGLEFYFPPLRNLGAAAGFGAFGALSIALPVAAAAGLGLTGGPGAQGWLMIILVGGFALPILAFGVVFIALAAYLLANSLRVMAEPDHIATVRRLFGLTLSRRTLSCSDIAAVEPLIPARFQNQFSAEPRYQLIARSRNPTQANLVIAESLPGRAAMEQMAALIAGATGIGLTED
ncbi:MAG: hypothetical protein OEP48_15470 [Betaproteobacteria bacterium]|nr:hypothetical protein [Betaproteobacteria bacterium]MDH3438598.1 hypothetical protein [Betaproteobacteria bacterium]